MWDTHMIHKPHWFDKFITITIFYYYVSGIALSSQWRAIRINATKLTAHIHIILLFHTSAPV